MTGFVIGLIVGTYIAIGYWVYRRCIQFLDKTAYSGLSGGDISFAIVCWGLWPIMFPLLCFAEPEMIFGKNLAQKTVRFFARLGGIKNV